MTTIKQNNNIFTLINQYGKSYDEIITLFESIYGVFIWSICFENIKKYTSSHTLNNELIIFKRDILLEHIDVTNEYYELICHSNSIIVILTFTIITNCIT